MKIGIDIRPLQTGHKFRGIGEVTKQVTDRILKIASLEKNPPTIVFYEFSDNDPKDLLDIPKNLKTKVVKVGPLPEGNTFRSKARKISDAYKALYGKPVPNTRELDVFLQFDYGFGVPKDTKTVLIKHDLIPYIFKDKFFTSAWVPFRNKAARSTLRTLFANHKFHRQVRRGVRSARTIIAVSHSTKRDLQRLLKVPEKKIKVAHLGVDLKPAKTQEVTGRNVMPTKPYLLFVGAGDARRRVDDLVAAYNNLKASGYDIQLVLVGENFRKPSHIPNQTVRNAVTKSSYAKDILTMGYVDDETKQELFKNALAYVYPTKYEGFGIPVLEAMLLNCPVITYKNSSIPEVAGGKALYADNWEGIVSQTKTLITMPAVQKTLFLKKAKEHAEMFTWDKTAKLVYDELVA